MAACCCYIKYVVHMYIKQTVCQMCVAGLGKESVFYVWLIHILQQVNLISPQIQLIQSLTFKRPFFPPNEEKFSYTYALVKSNQTYEDFFQKEERQRTPNSPVQPGMAAISKVPIVDCDLWMKDNIHLPSSILSLCFYVRNLLEAQFLLHLAFMYLH